MMMRKTTALVGMASAVSLVLGGGVAAAHPGESDGGMHAPDAADGHVEANTNYGFEAVGHSALAGIQDGRYTDVWAHGGHAYVGSFQNPTCSRDGVYITDLADPTNPTYIGGIKSPPNTRVNDVKVTTVGKRDVLIFSLEKCGASVGNAGQKGQGGIALWDVTDPTKPHALKQNFLDFQVHNTFPWTTEDGKTYALVVDDEAIDDLHVIDLTKPQSPKHIAQTGIGTWLADGTFDIDTDQLFTGVFAASLLHDVWVEFNPTTNRWEGVLSYWDAGFITVDLSDPTNPTYIADHDYPADDPVLGDLVEQPEGNAHAAVFGGDDNEFIFGGDEDFDVLATAVAVGEESFGATTGSDTPAPDTVGLTGTPVYVGLACSGIAPAADATDIAVIVRGDCAFTTKAATIEAAGYAAGVVFNQDAAGRCEASVSMLVEGGVPMVFVPRSAGFAMLGIAYDPAECGDGSTDALLPTLGTAGPEDVTVSAVFDGWGYFWGINNSTTPVTYDGVEYGHMDTVGWYAPAEVADPALASGAGDLTMHNLETDIAPEGRHRSFISWYSLGMRAIEFREGHAHDPSTGGSVYAKNFHEVGRWIADEAADETFGSGNGDLVGSNFWGVTQFVDDEGKRYVLGSDRNTGLWVFEWTCEGPTGDPTLYCVPPVAP